MKPTHGIAALLIGVACIVQAEESEPAKSSGVTVMIHDSQGVSFDSAPNQVLEVILFKSHTHIHFKISNTTDKGLTLWRPYCPQGDAAMSIEFREVDVPDKVYRSYPGYYAYTRGMGIPKVFTLAPSNDLIVNVDFLSEWILPMTVKADQTRELEMRAVYRSVPLTDEQKKRLLPEPVKIEQVWSGGATSNWQKVRIINRTGATVEPKK